jgi:hypothetical protein
MRFSTRHLRLLVAALLVALTPAAHAGWVLKEKLTAYPPIAKEKFGCAAAMDGLWLAVGATDTALPGFQSTGAVHLFERVGDQWILRQTLFHPTPANFQAFGCSLALRGDHLVVGSWGSDVFAGRAFVYTRDGDGHWTLTATLKAADPQPAKPALFGWTVALDMPASGSGVIAVGRVNDSSDATGAVYVFEGRDASWSQVAKLTAPDAVKSDQLGTSLSVRQGTLVAGVPRRRVVHVFARTLDGDTPKWTAAAKLTPAVEATGDNFGYSVASAGTLVAVGAPNRSGTSGESRAGAVTVFYNNGSNWQEGATLTARTESSGDSFGYAVALAPLGDSTRHILVASAPLRAAPLNRSGAAFAFRGTATSWTLDDSDLWTPTALANQNIGKALAVSSDGSAAVVATDGPTNSTGGAFPFIHDSAGSTGNGATTSSSSSGGGGAGGGGGGGAGGGGGGDAQGGAKDGLPGDLAGQFGPGGGVRSVNMLPRLVNTVGTVADTVFINDSIAQALFGVQVTRSSSLTSDIQGVPALLATYPDNLRFIAAADCNGDGGSDLIWQDRLTNEVVLWTRNGATITKKQSVASPPAGLTAVAAYNIAGDGGAADILLVNPATAIVRVLKMSDGAVADTVDLQMPGGSWRPVPFAFIANSVLVRHTVTGELRRITLPSAGAASRTIAVDSPPASYEIQAIGDLDADGQPDIVARSADEDQVRFYLMNGNKLVQVCTGIPTAHWNVVGMRDYDGNGVNDLVLSEAGGDHRIVVLFMEVLSDIPQIKSNQVIGRFGAGAVVGLGER